MTVSESVYSIVVQTDSGPIEIIFSATLGDLTIGVLLILILLFMIVKSVIKAVWQ